MKAFLLKLVGLHPDQVKERKRFERNLKKLDDREADLDELLEKIHSVEETLQNGQVIVLASDYPPLELESSKEDGNKD